jgi:hypothetical protein
MGVVVTVENNREASAITSTWWGQARAAAKQGSLPRSAEAIVQGEAESALLSIWDWWDLWYELRRLPGWQAVESREISARWVPEQPSF